MTRKEKAMELHDKGYNCAQSVACSFCEEIGVSEEILFAACEGFGLGMGGMEATCGAISGAVVAAGFKNSTGNPKEPFSKRGTYQISKEIVKDFEEKNKALICKDLKGIETGEVLRSCSGCIMDAVEAAERAMGLQKQEEME